MNAYLTKSLSSIKSFLLMYTLLEDERELEVYIPDPSVAIAKFDIYK
jgi:hypothetical protein